MKYILNHEDKLYRKFFEDIASIPHESFKEKALSDYIVKFAEDRGLWHHQDQVWNVIIKKPASPGYEDHDPVMIQGHIDMVCVKTADSDHDFDTDPLELYVEDGFLRAKNTTLGADCGHGISYMLAILDDKSLKHPPLECLFTVQEEVGVGGPKHLDYSLLTAKRLIFTDSMGEGAPEMSTTSVLGGNFVKPVTFEAAVQKGGIVGSSNAVASSSAVNSSNAADSQSENAEPSNAAGLSRDTAEQSNASVSQSAAHSPNADILSSDIAPNGSAAPLSNSAASRNAAILPSEPASQAHFYKISVGGLAGGHAAVDINKGRANAVSILARTAYELMKAGDIKLCSFKAGTLKNNIPNTGEMVICTALSDVSGAIAKMDANIKAEHKETDPAPFVKAEVVSAAERSLSVKTTAEIIRWVMEIPTGCYMASHDDASFPLTSRNMGTAELMEDKFVIGYMFRTSVKSHLEMLFDAQMVLCEIFGASWEKEYDYPGYVSEVGTPMYNTYETVYRQFTGKELKPIRIHAGTDVGSLIEGMGGLDVIGIGPNTYKFHTPEEALDLASYDRAYRYITGVLEKL